jgi:hypothetical protein
LFPRHKVDSMVALLSKPGCKAQLAHTDYTPATLANATDEDDAARLPRCFGKWDCFDVWPEAIRFEKNVSYKHMQVKLNKGDVLVFRGDLVHGGAACGEVENVRIHAYLDVDKFMYCLNFAVISANLCSLFLAFLASPLGANPSL